jgi:hypothetical protein
MANGQKVSSFAFFALFASLFRPLKPPPFGSSVVNRCRDYCPGAQMALIAIRTPITNMQ